MSALIPDTIRGRLVATFTLLFALVTAPLTIYIVRDAQSSAEDQALEQFERQASTIASLLARPLAGGDDSALRAEVEAAAAASGFTMTLFDATGEPVVSSSGEPTSTSDDPSNPAISLLDSMSEQTGLIERDDVFIAMAAIPGGAGAVVAVQAPSDALVNSNSGLWQRALVGLAAALAIVVLLSWGVSRRISAPLENLRSQATAVSTGDLSVSVDPEGPRDIRDLTAAFNTMTGQIRELIGESTDARQRLEMIFENLNEGVIVVNSAEEVVTQNRRAREILGTTEHSGDGLPFVLVVRDHDLIDHLRTTMRAGAGSTVPIEYARSGRSIEATAIPARSDGEELGIVVLRDVTEIRRLELVRREFVANVSHELRTPLASIRALADTLESGALEDPDVSLDFVQRIVKEVDRLTILVDELLDLARLESGRLALRRQIVAPADLIESGVERLKPQIERAGLSLSLEVPTGLPQVLADRARIEQVLLNLIHNAIKFTPPGGTITVSGDHVGPYVRVHVIDTGQGIPEAELPRIFERFYKADRSRRSEGTGLGLAISKHIIQAHDGEIWATSRQGEGATFAFSLPVAPRSFNASEAWQGKTRPRIAAGSNQVSGGLTEG
jgi:two-component system phosphate regulon sensor histidine kinase PhoR